MARRQENAEVKHARAGIKTMSGTLRCQKALDREYCNEVRHRSVPEA